VIPRASASRGITEAFKLYPDSDASGANMCFPELHEDVHSFYLLVAC
jgi:hypothetical protein